MAILVLLAIWTWSVRESPDAILAVVLTCGTFWGLVATLTTLREVWLEKRAQEQRQQTDQALLLIAGANVRREALRALGFLCILILAVAVVMGLSTPVIGRSLLVLMIVLMIANALFDRRERGKTAPLLRESVLRDKRRN